MGKKTKKDQTGPETASSGDAGDAAPRAKMKAKEYEKEMRRLQGKLWPCGTG